MLPRLGMVLAGMLLLVQGFVGAQDTPPAIKVGVVTDNASESWKAFRNSLLSDGPAMGLNIDFRATSPGTMDQQRAAVEQLLAADVKVLVICPVDPVKQVDFFQYVTNKVPVILLLKDISGCSRVGCIGPDNKEVGKKMAEAVAKCVPGGMKIATFVADAKSPEEQARMAGLEEGVTPLDMIIDVVKEDHGDLGLAVSNVQGLLAKRPEIAGYIGFQPYHAVSILKMAEAYKRDGIIGIVGYGDSPELKEAFAKGHINGVVKPDITDLAKLTLAAAKSTVTQDGSFAWPENKYVHSALVTELSPKTMGVKEQLNAISGGWTPEEVPGNGSAGDGNAANSAGGGNNTSAPAPSKFD